MRAFSHIVGDCMVIQLSCIRRFMRFWAFALRRKRSTLATYQQPRLFRMVSGRVYYACPEFITISIGSALFHKKYGPLLRPVPASFSPACALPSMGRGTSTSWTGFINATSGASPTTQSYRSARHDLQDNGTARTDSSAPHRFAWVALGQGETNTVISMF